MSLKGNGTRNYFIGWLACLIWIAASSACAERIVDNLTLTSPYANMIGVEYRTVAEIDAYGIYENLDRKVVSYITLISGVGISGPEVAFKRRIAKGQNIKILSAWRERKLLYNDIYYVVALQDANFPRNVQVRIDLSRGNEGVSAGLNPRFYERR